MKKNHDNGPEMRLNPVGLVRSEIKTPVLLTGETDLELQDRMDKIRQYHRRVRNVICEVVVFPEWEELLDGIEGFSHVLVLYWPHLIKPGGRRFRKVHPMGRKDLPRQGVFATCSPSRPNPILVSAVRLLGREGNVLRVKGLEAVDGSPVIDIKPYSPSYYGAENPLIPEWMERIHRELEENHGEEGEDG